MKYWKSRSTRILPKLSFPWPVSWPLWKAAIPLALTALCTLPDWGLGQEEIVRSGQERAMLVLAAFSAFAILKRAISSPLAAFISYASLMWVLHDYEDGGMRHLIHIAAAVTLASWLARHPKECAKWITLIALFESIFGIAQFLGWNPWHYEVPWYLYKPSGTFGQETILGAFLAAALAPALFTRRYWAAIPIFLCCLATKSSMTVFAAGFVLALWSISLFEWMAVSAIYCIFFVAAAYFSFHPDAEWFNFNGRQMFWEWAYHKWRNRTVFGWGPGSWQGFAPTFELRLTHAHNEFLEFLCEYGVAGALAPLWGAWEMARRWRLEWPQVMVVALLVNSIGNFPLHIASTGTLFLVGYLISIRGEPAVLYWKRS